MADLHVWSIGSETPALSAHVVLTGPLTLHEAQTRGDGLKAELALGLLLGLLIGNILSTALEPFLFEWGSAASPLLYDNLLTNVVLPSDLKSLVWLDLALNKLEEIDLPPGMPALNHLDVRWNPLRRIRLPAALATGALADTVATLRGQGVEVILHGDPARLSARREGDGSIAIAITGPVGNYAVEASHDLIAWLGLGRVANLTGTATVTDRRPALGRQFYRAFAE